MVVLLVCMYMRLRFIWNVFIFKFLAFVIFITCVYWLKQQPNWRKEEEEEEIEEKKNE